jgi:hypothetical protein
VPLHSFVTLAPDGSGQHDIQAALRSRKSRGTQVRWVGPRAGLDVFEEEQNLLFLPIFEPRTVQPSHCINCSFPAPEQHVNVIEIAVYGSRLCLGAGLSGAFASLWSTCY